MASTYVLHPCIGTGVSWYFGESEYWKSGMKSGVERDLECEGGESRVV